MLLGLVLSLILDVESRTLDELNEREIGAAARTTIDGNFSQADFLRCVPRESIPFPKAWAPELQDKVFGDGALSDLMKCSQTDCAFNFSSEELAKLQKSDSKDARKQDYIDFYKRRASGETVIEKDRKPFLIRSSEKAFEGCDDPRMHELLDTRPSAKFPKRLSHVRYNPKMRQTTRVLQSVNFPTKNGFCFAEALIFSDHYDLDRVEVWSLIKSEKDYELSVQVRQRLDFLNSWFRRLNKQSLVKELRDALKNEVEDASNCLKTK